MRTVDDARQLRWVAGGTRLRLWFRRASFDAPCLARVYGANVAAVMLGAIAGPGPPAIRVRLERGYACAGEHAGREIELALGDVERWGYLS